MSRGLEGKKCRTSAWGSLAGRGIEILRAKSVFKVTLAEYKSRTFPGVSGVQPGSPEMRELCNCPVSCRQ